MQMQENGCKAICKRDSKMKVLFLRRINAENPAELFVSTLKANSSGRSQRQGEPDLHQDLGLPTQEVRK